jgi:hypothetical protein
MQTHLKVAKQIDISMIGPQVLLKSVVHVGRVRKSSVRVANRYRTRPNQKHQQTSSSDQLAKARWLTRFV